MALWVIESQATFCQLIAYSPEKAKEDQDCITGTEVMKPIYEIASSHLARRTFIGNLYNKVKDPNLIGSMTGHSPGSEAFARYHDINDEVKKTTVQLLLE